jgi:glycosyltransferase involved in cell wall biosynthesis
VTEGILKSPRDRASVPLVSIGLPVFNGARFLKQALDSLLGQSFSNIEMIISDNASTDDTEAICRAYAAMDARVQYYRQTVNIGAPHNWNYVAKQARGKYFKWSSGNDFCSPDMVKKCIAVMDEKPEVVLCYGRTCLVDEETGRQEEYAHDIAVIDPLPHKRFKTLCRTLALNNAQSGLIRTEALRRTRYDRPYPSGDIVLMAELALQGQFVLLPDVLLYRRIGQNTFSSLQSAADTQQFFNPGARRSIGYAYLRLHLDFLCTSLRASICLQEKLRTLMLVFRHAIWDRKKIWAELRARPEGARHA